jgi:STE24 endopeptidase
MDASFFTAFFICALLLSTLLKYTLTTRQMRHVGAHQHAVPSAFLEKVSLQAHQKAANYALAKGQLELFTLAWGRAVLVGWTLLGGLDSLSTAIAQSAVPGWGNMAYQLTLVCAFMLIGSVLDLPFDLYRIFRLEQRFGFNRMTPKLYCIDLFKKTLLSVLIGLPIVALILWVMAATGSLWWLWTWGTWMAINLSAMLIYPAWIAPLFNQFKPLQDPAVQTRVLALMQRCGFSAKGLYVMDGSTRSSHSNAYFTGLGRVKRVVFFDTLLASLSPAEMDAVLAHELGHFKHKHVPKRIAAMFVLSLGGLALLGWLIAQPWFYTGLGVQPSMLASNHALALLLFLLATPVLGFLIGPVFAWQSRKDEFQADAYASTQTSSKDLANALMTLYRDNANTLTPDPWYARFYYSHPPASERIQALSNIHTT